MTATPDIDTQIEEILRFEIGHINEEGRFCATYKGKECNCGISSAHKAIKTLLIQSKIDELDKLPRITYTKDGVASDVSILLQHQHIKARTKALKEEL